MKRTIKSVICLIITLALLLPNIAVLADDKQTVDLGTITIYAGGCKYVDVSDLYASDISSDDTSVVTASIDYYTLLIKGVSIGQTRIRFNGLKYDTNYYINNVVYYYSVNVVKPRLSVTKKSMTIDMNDDSDYGDSLGEYGYCEARLFAVHDGYNSLTVTSSNTSVLKVKCVKYNSYGDVYESTEKTSYPILLYPQKKGKATVKVADKFGNVQNVAITVTDKEGDAQRIEDEKDRLYDKSFYYEVEYGDTVIEGKTVPSAAVTLNYNKKTYKTKANNKGIYKFSKLPVCKIGTAFTLKYATSIAGIVYKDKVINPKPKIKFSRLYYKSTKFKGSVTNVHKGDIIRIKIGKKTYTKKVKKNTKTFKLNFKIKKAKYGTKVTVTVTNKFKQKMKTRKEMVYYASKLKTGMTEKQATCVPGWEYPDVCDNYSSGYYLYYDDDGDGFAYDSYLMFNSKGKLIDWYFQS